MTVLLSIPASPTHKLFEMPTLAQVVAEQAARNSLGPLGRLNCYTILFLAKQNGAPSHSRQDAPDRGDLYFISPGQLLVAGLPPHATGQAIRFTDEFFCLTGDDKDLLLHFSLFHPTEPERSLPVAGEWYSELEYLLTQMRREVEGTGLLRDTLLRAYLKAFLIHCIRLQQQVVPTEAVPPSGVFIRFRNLLEGHYTSWKTVREYASHLNVTANHLSETIKRETGLPARDHILRRITLEAQRLAYGGELSLKEIACRLGYDDVSHFSRVFKRCNGVSFSEFRQQSRTGKSLPDEVAGPSLPASADEPGRG